MASWLSEGVTLAWSQKLIEAKPSFIPSFTLDSTGTPNAHSSDGEEHLGCPKDHFRGQNLEHRCP